MAEWIYSSTFSWHQHQLEKSGEHHAPLALPSDNHWIRGCVGPRSGKDAVKWKFLPYIDSSSDISVLQPVANRFTDCATAAPIASENNPLILQNAASLVEWFTKRETQSELDDCRDISPSYSVGVGSRFEFWARSQAIWASSTPRTNVWAVH
jgi:hypothetical protein